MGDVVNINKGKEEVKFKDYLENDFYLKLTCINALVSTGYSANMEGVKEFQIDVDLEPTGIIGSEELGILMMAFDENTTQDIIKYIDNLKKPKGKKISNGKIIFYLLWATIFMAIGFVDFWKFVYGLIYNLLH